jgi:hypothetical protein
MTETIPQPRTEEAADSAADKEKPASPSAGLLVYAPLRIEARAVRRGLTRADSQVVRAEPGNRRTRVSPARSPEWW